MKFPPSTSTPRSLLAATLPTIATLVGLQLGSAQPQVTLSFPITNIGFQITIGPPPIPIYDQPDIPEDGYIWTPGYWAWGEDGYFWVPGTWVMAPEIGLLWTPGYWGWGGDAYVFHAGYWGSHVGFYGGVNYGHGYGGSGFDGGHWQGRNYAYNRAVTNVNNTRITNVYNNTVIVNNNTHVAYNGGDGGLRAAPTAQDQTAERERHVPLTAEQSQQHQRASQDKELLASANRGKPPVAATMKPSDFSPKNSLPAKAAGGPVGEAPLKATPQSSGQSQQSPPAATKPAVQLTPKTAAPLSSRAVPEQHLAPMQQPAPAPNHSAQPANHSGPAPRPTVRPSAPPAARPATGQRPAEVAKSRAQQDRKPESSKSNEPSSPQDPYLLPPAKRK